MTQISTELTSAEKYVTNSQYKFRLCTFIFASILFHSGIIYFINIDLDPFIVKRPDNNAPLIINLVPAPSKTPIKRKITTPVLRIPNRPVINTIKSTIEKKSIKKLNAQQLINNSIKYIRSSKTTGDVAEPAKAFDFPGRDIRTYTEMNNSAEQDIESFKLTNGNTLLKMTSFFGKPYCIEIQYADPLNEFSTGIFLADFSNTTKCGINKPTFTIK